MITNWDEMKFWDIGEFQAIEEGLDDLDKAKIVYNPERDKIFAALDACPFLKTRVAIFGQDPYPNHEDATGLAFSVPPKRKFPPTLVSIFNEYHNDLGLPVPKSGSLTDWADQGVLLWNVIPTCEANKSLSHEGWLEWRFLTDEIISSLCNRNVKPVLVFLGGRARSFVKEVPEGIKVIETSHPSPRGSLHSKVPFSGSRIFSRINDALCELDQKPIDWRLS
jgi:uracil-DNA glycosylase